MWSILLSRLSRPLPRQFALVRYCCLVDQLTARNATANTDGNTHEGHGLVDEGHQIYLLFQCLNCVRTYARSLNVPYSYDIPTHALSRKTQLLRDVHQSRVNQIIGTAVAIESSHFYGKPITWQTITSTTKEYQRKCNNARAPSNPRCLYPPPPPSLPPLCWSTDAELPCSLTSTPKFSKQDRSTSAIQQATTKLLHQPISRRLLPV